LTAVLGASSSESKTQGEISRVILQNHYHYANQCFLKEPTNLNEFPWTEKGSSNICAADIYVSKLFIQRMVLRVKEDFGSTFSGMSISPLESIARYSL